MNTRYRTVVIVKSQLSNTKCAQWKRKTQKTILMIINNSYVEEKYHLLLSASVSFEFLKS